LDESLEKRTINIPPMSSCIKALNIDIIVDEVIWLSQAGSCKFIECENSFSNLNLYLCLDREAHLRALSRCILVCKLWARIGISQLWGFYTEDKHLLALIVPGGPNMDLMDLWREEDRRGPTIGTEVRYVIMPLLSHSPAYH
jgi:hypothetical protein